MGQRRAAAREKRRRITRDPYIWAVLWFIIVSVCGFSSDPAQLSISQAYADLPEVIAYVDVLDGAGNRVEGIAKDQFSATVGQYRAVIDELGPFESIGEGTAYIVLVDISKTLREKEFKQIRESLNTWIDNMGTADRMMILTFGESCTQRIDFTGDKVKLKEVVKALKPTGLKTQLYKALQRALQMEQRRDVGLPARRAIVVLSDGKDEGSGLYETDVKKEIEKYHLPIYSIGYSRLKPGDRERFLNVLNNFSIISGGVYVEYLEAEGSNIQAAYETIRKSILRVYRLGLLCETCRGDGRMYRLQVNLASGTHRLTAGMNVMLLPPPPPPTTQTTPPPPKKIPIWVYAAAGGVFLLLVILIVVLTRKRKKTPVKDESVSLAEKEEQVSEQVTELPPVDKPKTGGLSIRLVEVGGKGTPADYHFVLAGEAVIGRKPGCEVVLEGDMDISREHFQLIFEDGNVLVQDLGTTNGTLVNGVPITDRFRLESGDRILVGRTELRIIFERGES